MLRLWVKDNINGMVHEYGTSRHDSLVLQKDGSLHYENVQCCAGTKYPEEGYSFCREDGTVPDVTAVDVGDEYLDIGAATSRCGQRKKAARFATSRQSGSARLVPAILICV